MYKKLTAICLALLFLALPLLFSGCADKITEGEVVEKTFEPAHTAVRILPIIRSNGKTTHTTYVPFIYQYPDLYCIEIQKYDEKNGEIKRATYRVTADVYNTVEVGDHFIYTDEAAPTEPVYTREQQ